MSRRFRLIAGVVLVVSTSVWMASQETAIGAVVSGGERPRPAYRVLYVAHPHMRSAGDRLRWDIYAMDPDGSRPQNLTGESDAEFDPTWSPDRTRIAFASVVEPSQRKSDLYVMHADGSHRRRLTEMPKGT